MNAGEWVTEIESAQKREKDYRDKGEKVLKIYEGDDQHPFNILYSNTETLLPALYSAVPRPVVQRRFKDADPLGKAAAQAGKRVLEFLLDTNIDGYETFDEGVRSATLDALLPGRGVTAVKYDAEIYSDVKASELVCLESKQWNRIYFGYARKWSKVPWIAYEEYVDKEEAERLFGEKANDLQYTDEDKEDDEYKDPEEQRRKVTCFYQIWDKSKKQVVYVSPGIKEILREDDDPLGLTGFFNTPKPISFLEKNDLNPVAIYNLYENQARELNQLTLRINKVARAIKARGFYDGALGDELAKVIEDDDNALIPTDTASSLASEKGLGNAIWFMPIEQLVTVLEKLYLAREQCKQVIYEITGIADIIRGSSKASETLGAQQIKEKWGGLRLKRLQKEVQRYARDLLRMKLEIAATKFSEKTWAQMTGLPFNTEEDVALLQRVKMAATQTGQPIDPQMQQRMAQPAWADVLGMLKQDQQRAYRIDVETNSTVEPEAVEDQKNIYELLNALGQYLNGVGPLVEKGIMPFEAARSMMMAISRRFRFGQEIEDQIASMQPPKQDDESQNQLMELQTKLAEMQTKLAQVDAEKQLIQDKAALDKERSNVAVEKAVNTMMKEQLQKFEQLMAEKFSARESALQAQQSSGDKVRSAQEKLAKKDSDAAMQVGTQVAGAMDQLQGIVQNLAMAQAELLKAVSEQSLRNEQMIGQLISAMSAPRRNKAIRGQDGRIMETVSELMQ